MFVDLFSGGGNVGINVKAERVLFNDKLQEIINLFIYWKSKPLDELLDEIDSTIKEYELSNSSHHGYEYYGTNSSKGLSKYNDEKWRKLRADYNETRNIKLLYPLIIFTFNNNIKFDKDGNFIAGGCNKRDFNKSMRGNFIKFKDALDKTNAKFTSNDFNKLNPSKLHKNDFVYCDPPYLITEATYNSLWNEDKEVELLSLLDDLHKNDIKFALSNVLFHKGLENKFLMEWAGKYNLHILDKNYNNSNYHKNSKEQKQTVEVLVKNY